MKSLSDKYLLHVFVFYFFVEQLYTRIQNDKSSIEKSRNKLSDAKKIWIQQGPNLANILSTTGKEDVNKSV